MPYVYLYIDYILLWSENLIMKWTPSHYNYEFSLWTHFFTFISNSKMLKWQRFQQNNNNNNDTGKRRQ